VLFLGGPVAGLLPLAAALATIAGSLLVLNALAGVVAVSEFAVNVVTLLGLGLAVDYSLLMVTRLTLVPALIAVAHQRIPAPGSRTWVWRRGRTPGPGLLARLAVFAQRRPAAVALTVTAALVAVSVPAFGLDAANADASSLPGSAEGSTRQRLPQAKRERVATSRALVRPAIHGSRRSS
jgi:RND superfamily putative drug exporter